MKRPNRLPRANARHNRVVFMAVFGLLAAATLLAVRAAMPTASFETEQATPTQHVQQFTDTTASGGQAVQFGVTQAQSWKPLRPGTAWQWQLTGTVNETLLDGVAEPKMYDIDLFNASQALISRLKAKNIYVVCYMESGDWSQTRPDAGEFAPSILGRPIGGFPDEKFVNINALDGPAGPTGKTLRQIMMARLDMAKNKGCDGIEPDLDDLHDYNTGFSISQAQMVAYNKVIIDAGHARGMSVGLKNGAGGSFVQQMLNAGADWVLNEECNQYDECDAYSVFLEQNKAVFQVEYLDAQDVPYGGANGTCSRNNAAGFDGIVKDSSSILAALPRIACKANR